MPTTLTPELTPSPTEVLTLTPTSEPEVTETPIPTEEPTPEITDIVESTNNPKITETPDDFTPEPTKAGNDDGLGNGIITGNGVVLSDDTVDDYRGEHDFLTVIINNDDKRGKESLDIVVPRIINSKINEVRI